jgi:hypothetical protein
MLEYMKLAKIAMGQMINSIKDERCFNNLDFIKSKLHNWLTTHLDLMVWMFAQQFYMLEKFSYPKVIATWKEM